MRVYSDIKVLVIDDSKTIRRTAETILQKEGFMVYTADDGFGSLSQLLTLMPDVIFIDVMMPRLDGYQTSALLKNHPKLKHIPIVMLSSKDGLFDKAKGKVVGAFSYVTKPFTKEELVHTLHQVFPDLRAP